MRPKSREAERGRERGERERERGSSLSSLDGPSSASSRMSTVTSSQSEDATWHVQDSPASPSSALGAATWQESDEEGPKPSDLYGKFTWKIDTFSEINKRELRSNVFEVGGYKWYILVYPQGCDVCNHLSLFLCVADYDKLLPGWNHFAQFTIAVVNRDAKKSKYSDTLHRFCKKEHDWGWKKFMERGKMLDGFTCQDTLVIKAQVQVIRENPSRPFRCLDCQYRRELVRVYLANVENICRRFVDEKRDKLGKLLEDSPRWLSLRSFWAAVEDGMRRRLARERSDVILRALVKRFFNDREVTSTLVMDALYSGCRELFSQSKLRRNDKNGGGGGVGGGGGGGGGVLALGSSSLGNGNVSAKNSSAGNSSKRKGVQVGGSEGANGVSQGVGNSSSSSSSSSSSPSSPPPSPPVVWMEKGNFVLAGDVLVLLERAVGETIPSYKEEKVPQSRSKEMGMDEVGKEVVERDERRLTELGRRTVEMFVLTHLFSNRVEVAYREAVALKRQEELIREEEAAEAAERESMARREQVELERRSKKKQAKQRKKDRKEKKAAGRIAIEEVDVEGEGGGEGEGVGEGGRERGKHVNGNHMVGEVATANEWETVDGRLEHNGQNGREEEGEEADDSEATVEISDNEVYAMDSEVSSIPTEVVLTMVPQIANSGGRRVKEEGREKLLATSVDMGDGGEVREIGEAGDGGEDGEAAGRGEGGEAPVSVEELVVDLPENCTQNQELCSRELHGQLNRLQHGIDVEADGEVETVSRRGLHHDEASSTCSSDSLPSIHVNGGLGDPSLIPRTNRLTTELRSRRLVRMVENSDIDEAGPSGTSVNDSLGGNININMNIRPEGNNYNPSTSCNGLDADTIILSLKERVQWLEQRLQEKEEEVLLLQEQLRLQHTIDGQAPPGRKMSVRSEGQGNPPNCEPGFSQMSTSQNRGDNTDFIQAERGNRSSSHGQVLHGRGGGGGGGRQLTKGTINPISVNGFSNGVRTGNGTNPSLQMGRTREGESNGEGSTQTRGGGGGWNKRGGEVNSVGGVVRPPRPTLNSADSGGSGLGNGMVPRSLSMSVGVGREAEVMGGQGRAHMGNSSPSPSASSPSPAGVNLVRSLSFGGRMGNEIHTNSMGQSPISYRSVIVGPPRGGGGGGGVGGGGGGMVRTGGVGVQGIPQMDMVGRHGGGKNSSILISPPRTPLQRILPREGGEQPSCPESTMAFGLRSELNREREATMASPPPTSSSSSIPLPHSSSPLQNSIKGQRSGSGESEGGRQGGLEDVLTGNTGISFGTVGSSEGLGSHSSAKGGEEIRNFRNSGEMHTFGNSEELRNFGNSGEMHTFGNSEEFRAVSVLGESSSSTWRESSNSRDCESLLQNGTESNLPKFEDFPHLALINDLLDEDLQGGTRSGVFCSDVPFYGTQSRSNSMHGRGGETGHVNGMRESAGGGGGGGDILMWGNPEEEMGGVMTNLQGFGRDRGEDGGRGRGRLLEDSDGSLGKVCGNSRSSHSVGQPMFGY